MKAHTCFFILFSLVLAGSGQAQWLTTTYTLKGGWNSIYLSGDAGAIETVFPDTGPTAHVLEVWRWNPNPSQIQFTDSPLIPTEGTPDWSVWRREATNPDEGNGTTFNSLTGRSAYLVRCAGTAADTYSIPIKQSPLPPAASWLRNGANSFGFPTRKNGSSYPTFANYFATFPAAIAADTKIFKYVGGDLGPTNPIQVFSSNLEPLDHTQAYWFSSRVVGDFYAPVSISLPVDEGLAFGRNRSTVTLRIGNRSAAPVRLTFAPVVSESPPTGQPAITEAVPLTRRTFDPVTLAWSHTPISGEFSEVVGPQSTMELQIGVNRADAVMAAAADDAFFASLLRITDSGNLLDVYLPVSASKASLAGLWLGEVELTNVSNKVSNGASASASVQGGRVNGITVTGGGYGYTSPPTVTIETPVSGDAATAIAEIANGAVAAVTVTSGGSGYTRPPRLSFGPPPVLTGTSVPDISRFRLRTLMHIAADGTATLLPQVFLGQLEAAPHAFGLCTHESLLKKDALATARRFVAAHLPLNQAVTNVGTATIPGTVECTIMIHHDDPTNPFVHQYHPDHDNKNPRGAPLPPGVESYDILRTATFTFTATPPAGSSITSGWGSNVIGGTYRETLTGLHKAPLQVDGTFELRRISEIATLTTPQSD